MSVESLSSGANQTQQDGEGGIWLTSLLGAQQSRGAGALPSPSPFNILLGLLALLTITYVAYQQALPKPIPGIPYNPASANSLLGDLPELFKQLKAGDLRGFFSGMTSRLDSPIVQFFGRPFSKPVIIISDFRTAQDILLRRNKEFDRPGSQIDTLRGVIPNHHISMLTSDPQFRKNRELVKDLMTPNFLHAVNAPEIWRNAVHFVDLWKWKARVADGRAFEAAEDVLHMTFDIIKNVAVGRDGRTTMEVYFDELRRTQLEEDHKYQVKDDTTGGPGGEKRPGAAITFPKPPYDETLEAQYRMNKALTPGVPVPMKIFHAINNRRPYMREAYASKERMLRRQVELAVQRHEAGEPLDSALDFMIRREMGVAQKEGRSPVFDSPAMFDELYGYLGAGHDTTATTFEWGLKHLAQHPEIQRRARAGLRAAHAEAHRQGRQPNVTEITRTQVPYLEAVIEEILRLSGPVSATARSTTTDTVIMGRAVPKGTTVFMSIWGPGITTPSVGGQQQQEGAAAAGTTTSDDGGSKPFSFTHRDDWDGMDPEKFLPERWLKKETREDGSGGDKVVYDAQAGPMLSFSLGLRGCFGRRLAYLTMRILFTLLVWNFELEPVPAELDSWTAVQILTRKPRQCYVRLREASGAAAAADAGEGPTTATAN